MANKTLFSRVFGKGAADETRNEAGGAAYALAPKAALAQYAATGCMNGTFYATAEEQLAKVMELANSLEPSFVARVAVYARQRGFMKDMPAMLCAVLAKRDASMLEKVFHDVIDNGKMLRTFVQIVRSGVTGRRSLGSAPKRLVRQWFERRTDVEIFRSSVGNDPSMADVIKMVHPRPSEPSREALYGWMIGREYNAGALPGLVREFEAFKDGSGAEVPNVPFQMLTGMNLSTRQWAEIARNIGWHGLRMNLNTFLRHGVFEDAAMVAEVARRIADRDEVVRARVFPYQLMAAMAAARGEMPTAIADALEQALEIATENVPSLPGKVYVLPDVSGSMSSPVTGHRTGSTTAVRCIDVAALVAAAVLRRNPGSEVIPFENNVCRVELDGEKSIAANAAKLAAIGGGGTNCSAPLAELNNRKARGDVVIYVSDNQSWVDAPSGRNTATALEWQTFKGRNPDAKLVCIDIQPYGTVQARNAPDVLNIGGFSDVVFEVIDGFVRGNAEAKSWVDVIEQITV